MSERECFKEKKPTRGGASKVCGNKEGSGQLVSAGAGIQEGGVNHGGEVEGGGGPEKNTSGGNGVEGIARSEGVEDDNKGGGIMGVIGEGGSGDVASGEYTHREKTES